VEASRLRVSETIAAMLRLIGLVVSIGLADSLNPGTIAPAMYLATGDGARARVTEFTVGVFVVYFLGGALIALGPGQLLLSLIQRPSRDTRHWLEIAIGAALVAGACALWAFRRRLAARELPAFTREGRSSALLGATITAFELPTAFPYFAAITAIVGSGIGAPRQLMLLLLFNICFVAPLVVMVATLSVAGARADALMLRARQFLERRWPVVLAVLLLLAGVLAVLLGATGLAGQGHGRFGRFARHFRHILTP
jgi:cytochrome c biogenesis protein CcdA